MIDGQQADNNLRPLTQFLFRCTFRAQEGDKVLTEAALKKLQYSVASVAIPKMKEQELDEVSYGSFFLSFPFWSTGDQAMTIDFWETDNMEISKIFYYMLDKHRWKSSTMFNYSQADLFVTVEILDQRSFLPPDKHVIFQKTYALKTVNIDPPAFTRDGDVSLLRVKIEFNTLQHEYSHGNIRSNINPLGDFMREGVYMKDTEVMINSEEMGDRIAEAFADLVQKEFESMYTTSLSEQEMQSKTPSWSSLRSDTGGDFILDQKELDKMYAVYKRVEGKNATMSKEDFGNMAQRNMNKLATGLHDMNVELKNKGFELKINTVNDVGDNISKPNHEWSSRSASHLSGSKADITILKNGEKVTIGSLTDEEAQLIKTAADNAKLVFNFESTAGKDTSLWADVHPRVFETTEGEKVRATSWTGNYMNVHVEGSQFDKDLVSGIEVERGATRRTAGQKMEHETVEAAKQGKRMVDADRQAANLQAEKEGLYGAQSTARQTSYTTLPPDNLKEVKAKGNSTFASSDALLK